MDINGFPRTAVEFDERFGTEEACRSYLMKVRWPNGFICPGCGCERGWQLQSRPVIECSRCHGQISLTAGTIFHGSRKPLRMWFKAIFLASAQKTGTSAKNLKRQLGLGSYQTAWTWLHKIRRAMVRPGREPLVGIVEVDESYVGGVEEGVRGRKTETKAVVAVAVEVNGKGSGRVRMERVEDVSKDSLQPFVERNVARGSTVKTDGWKGYGDLREGGRRHHKRKLYGDGKKASRFFPHVHRAVALLKRWLLGTHQGCVSHKHLPSYLNEFEFRFNRRRARDVTLLFQRVCEFAVVTPPMTYAGLVAQHVGVP